MARYTIPTICCTSGCPDSTCPTAACAWRRRRAHTSQPTRHIAERVGAFANEKIREYAGRQIIVVSHESPIWSYRHLLETGHPEHWMFLRKTALASITSITYDSDTGKVMSITYADPAAQVE